MEQQGNMKDGVTDSANATIVNDPRTPGPVRNRSFSEASTVISSDAVPSIKTLSLGDDSSTTNATTALTADEATIAANFAPTKADKPKLPLMRAALIAKAQAAKNGAVFAAPSATAKHSARLKTSNYKPILAAGKGSPSLSRLKQARKEAGQKKANAQEEAAAREKQSQNRPFLENTTKGLLQELPDEAVERLPNEFYELSSKEKLRVLIEAHVKYGKEGLGDMAGEIVGKVKGEESGCILGEIEQLEDLQELERSVEASEEHDKCICDECKEAQADVGGTGRIAGKVEHLSEYF